MEKSCFILGPTQSRISPSIFEYTKISGPGSFILQSDICALSGRVREAHVAGRRLTGRLLTHALKRHAEYYHQDVLIVVDALDNHEEEDTVFAIPNPQTPTP